jgi:outer membrane protein
MTMKNTASIITKLTLGVLIAGSIAACKQGPANNAASNSATTTVAPDKQATVFVNFDTLLSKYNYAKDVEKKLTDKGKNAQSDLQSKGQAFQQEVAQYQKDQSTLSADQRQTTEQRLQREQQQLQGYQQNATAEFQNERTTEEAKVFDKIADYTKQYAKDKGYKMVLTYSKSSSTLLYGDPSLDVTADMLKGLNDAYTKDGSSSK